MLEGKKKGRESVVAEESRPAAYLNLKMVSVIAFIVTLCMVCIWFGVLGTSIGNTRKVSSARAEMGNTCRIIKVEDAEVRFPMTKADMEKEGFSFETAEVPTVISADTLMIEDTVDVIYDKKTYGTAQFDESGNLLAFKVMLGRNWSCGPLEKGMAQSEILAIYGEPDKEYSGLYTGIMYKQDDYRMYLNMNGLKGTAMLSDFIYVMNTEEDNTVYDIDVQVGKKSIRLKEDITQMFSVLEQAGYKLGEPESDIVTNYSVLDKKGNRVGNIVYDGKVTGTYSLSFMTEDVSYCGVEKGMKRDEVTAVMADYGESEELKDGTVSYTVGMIYAGRELNFVLGFGVDDTVNYMSFNVEDIYNVPTYRETVTTDVDTGIATE